MIALVSDLAPNMDLERSVSCVGGTVNTDPASWTDDNGHGTWCAYLQTWHFRDCL